MTTDQNGDVFSQVRYRPYGEERWSSGETLTDFGFTGQRNEASFGLMDYKARYYNPLMGRFISPDPIVPDPTDSQTFNRYAYAYNNPVRYNDPSGHCGDCLLDAAFITYDIYQIQQEGWTPLNTAALVVDVTFAFVPVATGGGPGLRLAFGGGEALQTGIRVGQEARAAQLMLMAAQTADQGVDGSSNSSRTETGSQKFENKFPDDPLGQANLVPLNRLKEISGRFNYVVLENGKLLVGKGDHIDIARGESVLAAGEVKVVKGKLKYIDNASGHYLPTGKNAQQAAENAFQDIGFKVNDKYI